MIAHFGAGGKRATGIGGMYLLNQAAKKKRMVRGSCFWNPQIDELIFK
jgi:hypothetical protein